MTESGEIEKARKEQIKICPKCGSTDITWDYSNAWVIRLGVNRDICNKCGLKGIFPVIDREKIKEFRKYLKKC